MSRMRLDGVESLCYLSVSPPPSISHVRGNCILCVIDPKLYLNFNPWINLISCVRKI